MRESEGAGQRASEGGRLPAGGVAGQCALFPGLSSASGRTRCPEPSLPRRAVAGSGHIPEPTGAKRSPAGEAKAGGWTVELTRAGGGELRRGAKLSNCARSPAPGGGREGRKGEGRGGAGRSREGASGLAAPEQPLPAAVAAAAAGPDSSGAQGVCPAARSARRLRRLALRPPAPAPRAGPRGSRRARTHHAAAVPELDAGCAHAARGLPHLRRHLGDRRRNRVNSCARARGEPWRDLSHPRTLPPHPTVALCAPRPPIALLERGGDGFGLGWRCRGHGTVWEAEGGDAAVVGCPRAGSMGTLQLTGVSDQSRPPCPPFPGLSTRDVAGVEGGRRGVSGAGGGAESGGGRSFFVSGSAVFSPWQSGQGARGDL